MDHDPPPSYSSVVESGDARSHFRRRNVNMDDKDENKPSETYGQDDNSTSEKHNCQDNDTSMSCLSSHDDTSSYGVPPEKDSKTLDHTPGPSHSYDSSDQQSTQRLSFWGRVRKGLEDFAMFIIQILD